MRRNNDTIVNVKILNHIIMKNGIILCLSLMALLFISCEKDDHDECHECHIAIMECCGLEEDHQPGEHSVEIGEFCGDDLANVEANGWVATQSITHDGKEEFAIGDLVPASMIHCEEHADHDGHDH